MAYMRKYPQALENVPNRAEACTDESARQELTHGLSNGFLDCVGEAEGSMKMVAEDLQAAPPSHLSSGAA